MRISLSALNHPARLQLAGSVVSPAVNGASAVKFAEIRPPAKLLAGGMKAGKAVLPQSVQPAFDFA